MEIGCRLQYEGKVNQNKQKGTIQVRLRAIGKTNGQRKNKSKSKHTSKDNFSQAEGNLEAKWSGRLRVIEKPNGQV